MTRRRGKGEGSIRQRADGRWEARIDLGRGINGRRRRKSVFGATQADVVQQLRRQGGRAVDGQLFATSSPTVARYLEDWHATNSDRWRASTRRSYRTAIDKHLVPAFGPLRLEQLTPVTIQRWLSQHKAEHGARRRIELAHATLRAALNDAKRLQLVAVNAAELVRVPRPTKRPISPLTVDQAATLLKAAATHRLGALFSVALACGLRLGEVTGLRWDDVDLETGELRVRQQLQRVGDRLELHPLKTERSRRALTLPTFCLEALRAHRTRQLADRLKAGRHWTETGLVFTTYDRHRRDQTVGKGIDPANVRRTLRALLKAAKLPQVRFHDLRHGAASLLIAEGLDLVEVSQLLGHSEIRVTADLYAHLQRQTAAKAARAMDAILKPQGVR